jgi:hypothetical protein
MSRTPSGLSCVAYHKYAALLCYFDQCGEIRLAPDVSRRENLHDRISKVPLAFSQACKEYLAQLALTDIPIGQLYDAAGFHTLGHPDYVGLVLVDRFEALFELTAATGTLEHACPALCPQLSSLGIATGPGDVFLEPEQFLGELRQQAPLARPLYAITQLKLNGWAVLEHGGTFQQAALVAIGGVVDDVLRSFRESPVMLAACGCSPAPRCWNRSVTRTLSASSAAIITASP